MFDIRQCQRFCLECPGLESQAENGRRPGSLRPTPWAPPAPGGAFWVQGRAPNRAALADPTNQL